MFSCTIYDKDSLILALERATTLPVPCHYAPAPIKALAVGPDYAVLVDSTHESPASFTILNPATFLERVKTAPTPMILRESAGQLVVGIQPLNPAPEAPVLRVRTDNSNPAYVQLASIAKKASAYSNGCAIMVRNGVCQLSFFVGDRSEVLVDLLPYETYFSILNQGRSVSRQSLPPLSAHELLKALPFALLKLEGKSR